MSLGKIALEDLAAAVSRIEGDRATLAKVLATLRAAGIVDGYVTKAVAGDIQISAYPGGETFAFRITKTPITDMPMTPEIEDRAA